MEEREDQEMRRRKAETDQLFLLYQQEKDKKRKEDAHVLSDLHLKQAVNPFLIPFHHPSSLPSSKNAKIVNERSKQLKSMK